jgi:hypothetical protein
MMRMVGDIETGLAAFDARDRAFAHAAQVGQCGLR